MDLPFDFTGNYVNDPLITQPFFIQAGVVSVTVVDPGGAESTFKVDGTATILINNQPGMLQQITTLQLPNSILASFSVGRCTNFECPPASGPTGLTLLRNDFLFLPVNPRFPNTNAAWVRVAIPNGSASTQTFLVDNKTSILIGGEQADPGAVPDQEGKNVSLDIVDGQCTKFEA
jgi:hypothetical protein